MFKKKIKIIIAGLYTVLVITTIISYFTNNRQVVECTSFDLIILILSSPHNNPQRDVIRMTWLTMIPEKEKVKYFFAIGTNNTEVSLSKKLEMENSQYNDLLFIPIEDNYYVLTNKVLLSFNYISNKYDFRYLLKIDDDTFVNVQSFMKILNEFKFDKLYWGYFSPHATVFNKGKWKDTAWSVCNHYLPYALGGGYVLSKKLVQYIGKNSEFLRLQRNEDVSVGLWLSPLKVRRIHDIRFDTQYRSRGCRNYFLVLHKRTPYDQKLLFANLKNYGKLCNIEFDTIKPYSYNWTVLPSNCCKQIDKTTDSYYYISTT